MTSTEFGWKSLLHTDAPPSCSLKAALFTTYDRADERFLAEHLLPLLLKLNREPDGEGAERQYFLLELDNRLKQLHDRLVIVSSTAREEPGDAEVCESGTYGWLWRSIRHLTVGRNGKAVQHAKLWLLHWSAPDVDGVEYLEVVVSSSNMTRAAFRGQIQAAWRVCLELHPSPSKSRLDHWGLLPAFLSEIFTSAGDGERDASFVGLLARADCPTGITFIASVPGAHSEIVLRRTPWGAAGLRKIVPKGHGTVGVVIMTPFVGSWSSESLQRWCKRFEGSPDRVSLIWIDENHPWARGKKWLLPAATLRILCDLNVRLLRHNEDETDPFPQEHRTADERWSHAKLYFLTRGNSRRLLVTSANFSVAAWGRLNDNGELTIENFELGVCVEQATWAIDGLNVFDNEQSVYTIPTLPSRSATFIAWARATWDGKEVDVDCRCDATRELRGVIQSGGEWIPIPNWTFDANDGVCSAFIPWADSNPPPSLIQLMCEQETVRVPIFDERPLRDREATLPPEMDGDAVQMMRDELLFEQYGGLVAGADGGTLIGSGGSEDDEDRDIVGRPESYSVPAFDLARRHLGVVDNWANQANIAATLDEKAFERLLLERDAALLADAFDRQSERDAKKGPEWAIAARVAAEELRVRLKCFQEA